MKKEIRYCLAFLFALTFLVTDAQDMHFSQFYETSSLINPAITGVESHLRATLQHKEQWRSITVPFRTFAASFEMKINRKHSENGSGSRERNKGLFSNLAWGLSLFSDKAGDANFGLTQANLSLSSHVPMNENNSIALGLQASIAQRSIDYSKLIWPDQYTGTGYDQNINPGENVSSSNFIYGDFGAGLLWTYGKGEMYMTANDEIKANAGIAVYHINRPRESLITNNTEVLNLRYVIHGGASVGIKNTSLSIAPNFMLNFQGPSQEIVLGLLFKHRLREDSKYTGKIKSAVVSMGGYYRNRDAIIPAVLIEIERYAVGVSYDLNVSSLRAASSYRGGIELMVRFTGATSLVNKNRPRY